MVDSALKPDPKRKLFYGLFVFPLIIAVGMAVLLCTVVLMTREVQTPESLITAIKTGSPSKRWQKAFELSNELNQGRGMLRSEGVMKEVIHILKDTNEYDPKTRSYMALALSRFESPEAALALREVLRTDEDIDVRLHVIWALGLLKEKQAIDEILPYLSSREIELRKMAAYVLGSLGQADLSVPALKPLLDDNDRDVRWNSALSLARLGSQDAYPELLKMVDRRALSGMEGMSPQKIEEIMVSAVKGLALLANPKSQPILQQLAKSEESLKVRQAAIEALKLL